MEKNILPGLETTISSRSLNLDQEWLVENCTTCHLRYNVSNIFVVVIVVFKNKTFGAKHLRTCNECQAQENM